MPFDIDLTFGSDLGDLTKNLRELLSLSTQTAEAVKKTNTAIQTESRKSAVSVNAIETAYKNTAKAIGELNTTGLDGLTLDINKQAEALSQATDQTNELQDAADKLVASLIGEGNTIVSQSARIVDAINKETLAFERLIEERLLASNPKDQQKLNLEIAKQVTTIKTLKDELAKIGGVDSTNSQEKGFVKLRGAIQAAKDEAFEMKLQFGENSKEFEDAKEKAAILTSELDSLNKSIKALDPTKKFQAFETAIGGVIGSMQTLTGAIQLFGSESEAVQKVAQKLQGLFNLTQGINTIFTLKDSFTNLLGVLGLTRTATLANAGAQTIQAGAVTASTVAIEGETVATNIATASTNRFTAALLANPFTAIAVALAAIVVAIAAFSEGQESASEKQERLNDTLEREIELLKLAASQIDETSRRRIDALKAESDAGEAAGLSIKERQELESKAAQEAVDAAEKKAGLYEKEIEDVKHLRYNVFLLTDQIRLLKLEEKDEDYIKSQEKKLELQKEQLSNVESLIKGLKDAKDAQGLLNLEQQKENRGIELEGLRAIIKQRLAEVRDGSNAELQIKLEGLKLEQSAQIAALANDDAREAKRLAIIAETNKKRRELENEYLIQVLKNQKTADEVTLLRAKENSRDELDLKIKLLQDQQKIEINALNISEDEKLKIRLETEKKIGDLKRAFVLKEVQDAINVEKTNAQLRLALSLEFSEQELQAKKDLITAEEELQISAINASLDAEIVKQQKIAVIEAKARNDREALDRASFKRQLDDEIEFAKLTSDRKIELLQREIDSQSTGNLTKKALQREVYQTQIDQWELELKALETKLRDQIISQEEYAKDVFRINNNIKDTTEKLNEETANQFNDIWDALGLNLSENEKKFADSIVSNIQSIYASISAARQNDLAEAKANNEELLRSTEESIQATSDALNQQIELAKLGYANNVDAKQKELDQLNAIKKKALERSKQIQKEEEQLARIQQAVDAALQISALSVAAAQLFSKESRKGVPGIVLAVAGLALLLSTFFAFKSAVQSATPTEFGEGGTLDSGTVKGKSHKQGGVRLEGTNIYVEGEEEIIRKKSAKKYRKVLKAINDDDFSGLGYGDIKALLEGTGVAMRPDIAKEIIQDREMYQSIQNSTLVHAETEPLRKEMVAMREEIKGLRKDNSNKPITTTYPDGTVVEKKGNSTTITRKV